MGVVSGARVTLVFLGTVDCGVLGTDTDCGLIVLVLRVLVERDVDVLLLVRDVLVERDELVERDVDVLLELEPELVRLLLELPPILVMIDSPLSFLSLFRQVLSRSISVYRMIIG